MLRGAGTEENTSTSGDKQSGTGESRTACRDGEDKATGTDDVWSEEWWYPPQVAGRPPQLWRAAAEQVSGEGAGS